MVGFRYLLHLVKAIEGLWTELTEKNYQLNHNLSLTVTKVLFLPKPTGFWNGTQLCFFVSLAHYRPSCRWQQSCPMCLNLLPGLWSRFQSVACRCWSALQNTKRNSFLGFHVHVFRDFLWSIQSIFVDEQTVDSYRDSGQWNAAVVVVWPCSAVAALTDGRVSRWRPCPTGWCSAYACRLLWLLLYSDVTCLEWVKHRVTRMWFGWMTDIQSAGLSHHRLKFDSWVPCVVGFEKDTEETVSFCSSIWLHPLTFMYGPALCCWLRRW